MALPSPPSNPPPIMPISLPLGPRSKLSPDTASPTPSTTPPILRPATPSAMPEARMAGFKLRKSSLLSRMALPASVRLLTADTNFLSKVLTLVAASFDASPSSAVPLAALADALFSLSSVAVVSVPVLRNSSKDCRNSSLEFSKSAIIYADK